MKLTIAAIAAAIMLMVTPMAGAHSSGVPWSGQTWRVASGTNGAGQRNCANHVTFGSTVKILVSGLCGGGIGGSLNTTQGSFAVTFSDTRGAGKYAIGLWPENGSRPEVDFAEDKRGDSQRVLMTGTYHPLPGCTKCIHSKVSGDFTQTHTATVQRSSTGFTLLLDGKAWAHYASSYRGAMHVFIHNEAWGDSGTSTLTINSVAVS